MKGLFWLIVLLSFVVAAGMAVKTVTVVPEKKICFIGHNSAPDSACVWAGVADTPEEQEKGLSGKWWLPEGVGMLFKFEEPQLLTFWMKEMRMGLDFVWMRNGVVVDVIEGVGKPLSLEAERLTISPRVPADAVLEVNVGWVARHGIEVGDEVEF